MEEFNLSSRTRRLVAFFIDYMVILSPFIAVMLLFWDVKEAPIFSIFITAFILLTFFCLSAKDTFKGISFGRWVMGIKVVDKDNISEIPSFWRLFGRNTSLIIWIIEIFAWFNKNKQRLGDKGANTLVIKKSNSSNVVKRIFVCVVVLTFAFGFVMFGNTSMIKKSDPYKIAIEQIMQNNNIQNEVGGIKKFGAFPTENIETVNGVGNANLQIKIIGNRKNKTISVSLYKERNNDKWQIFNYNLY